MSTPGLARTPAPTPRASLVSGRLTRWAQQALEPFWVVPAAWCVAAVLLGLALPSAEEGTGSWLPLGFDGGNDGARAVLATIAGAMISVTGLVFSITIVVLQLASSQFTPRVLRTFLSDRLTQHTLGVFAASFLYALTVLRSVGDDQSGEQTPPQLAVTFAFLLVLGAVAMFLAFIHHITNSISVTTIVQQVADETRSLLKRSADRRKHLPLEEPDLETLPRQTVARASRTGHLDAIDFDRLINLAVQRDARIEVLYPVGSFVPHGAPVALIHLSQDAEDDWDDEIAKGLALRRERSMEQDVTYGIRRLVDIAERALSPGVNDPTTAVQVIDELHDILRVMATVIDPFPVHSDKHGAARLVTSEWTFGRYLDLAVDEIAHWGKTGLQVPARLAEMLDDLAVVAAPEHKAAVRDKASRVDLLRESADKLR